MEISLMLGLVLGFSIWLCVNSINYDDFEEIDYDDISHNQ